MGTQWSNGPHPMGPMATVRQAALSWPVLRYVAQNDSPSRDPADLGFAHLKLECLIFFSISNLRDNSDSQHFLNRKEFLTDD